MDLDQIDSQSLEIQQPPNRLTFNSSSEDPSNDNDLDYSKDQASLSFQIEENNDFSSAKKQQEREKEKQKISIPVSLNNEPPKRKRREIFDKYRRGTNQESQLQSNHSITQQEDIMRTFDEIFKINSPRNLPHSPEHQIETENIFKKKPSIKNQIDLQVTHNNNPKSANSLSIRRQDSMKEYLDEEIETVKINETELGNSDFFKTPIERSRHIEKQYKDQTQTQVQTQTQAQKQEQKQIKVENDILNLSDLEYRFSFIEGKENISISMESDELAEILKSEIFNEQTNERPKITTATSTFLKSNKKEVQQQIQKKQQQVSPQRERKQEKSSMSEMNSKFVDPYEKIDISSSSVTSSVMIRDTKYAKDTNFLGGGTFDKFAEHHKINTIKSAGNLFQHQSEQNKTHKKLSDIQEHLDQRLPIFLRRIRYYNSIYPNFQNKNTIQSLDGENAKLNKIVSLFYQAIKFIYKVLTSMKERDSKMRQFLTKINRGISVKQFLSIQWTDFDAIEGLYKVEPKMNFNKRQWNEKKVQKALENYKKIAEYYRNIKLNLEDQRGITKYFQIRKKFWDVEKNLIMIAEDIFAYVTLTQFPLHFYEYARILMENKSIYQHNQILNLNNLVQKIRFLKSKSDPLSLSEVGDQVLTQINKIIRLHEAY